MDLDYKKIKDFWDDRAKKAHIGMSTVNLGTTPDQSAVQLERLKKSLASSDEIILELGCGLGRVTQAMAMQGKKVVGVDFSFDMLLAMKEGLDKRISENIAIVCANGSKGIPFQPASFDVTVIFGLLLHINDADVAKVIREAKRVTKVNGKIILRESVGVAGRFEVNKYSEELKSSYSAIYRSVAEIENEFLVQQLRINVSESLYQQRPETATWYWEFLNS